MLCWIGIDQSMKMRKTSRGEDKNPHVNNTQNYHPHGDSSIYDAAMRLAQSFSNNIILVDGHGNLGSQHGDKPAAQRYSEIRLSKFAENYLLKDINKNAVDMVPNYDYTTDEPTVLPAKTCLLLVNGASGIAAGGYAVEIPQHNLNEICNSIINIIDNPDITDEKIINSLLPDFPTGGILCSKREIHNAYKTGRGNVKYRCKIEHETTGNKHQLVITEVPYITTDVIMESILEYCKNNPDNGIKGIRNESNKGKIRLVIELLKDVDPNLVENRLYKFTQCQVTLKIILIATEFNNFDNFTIPIVLKKWINWRRETIKRIIKFDINKYQERIFILAGLIKALNDIDNVINIIKKSNNINDAKIKLMELLDLSDIQVNYILDMKLSKLTKLEINKLKDESKTLLESVKSLTLQLNDPKAIDNIIKQDQLEIIEKYPTPRKTEVIEINSSIDDGEIANDDDFIIQITLNNKIKKLHPDIYKNQLKGGKGINATKNDDVIKQILLANNRDNLLVFTNEGKVFYSKIYRIEENFKNIKNYFDTITGEIVSILCVPDKAFDENLGYLYFITKNGYLKKVAINAFKTNRTTGIMATKIYEDDELLNVLYNEKEGCNLLISSKTGRSLNINESNISEVLRPTFGTRFIKLKENDETVSICFIENEKFIFVITGNGYGKKVAVSEFQEIKRGFGKNIVKNFKEGDYLIKALSCNGNEDILVISKNKVIRMNLEDLTNKFNKRSSSNTRIITLNDGDSVLDLIKL